MRWTIPALLILVLAGGSCSGAGSDAPAAGTIRLPDGELYAVPAMPLDRPVLRDSAGLDRQWQEAGAAYQTGDYSRSARLFGGIEEAEDRAPERHDAGLYRGISLVLAGRHGEAIESLQRARRLARETGLGDGADSFYLGLAALAENDIEQATEALGRAVGGPYDREARTLLQGLTGG